MLDQLIRRVRAEESLEELNNTRVEPGHRQAELLSLYTGDEEVGNKFLAEYEAEKCLNKEMSNDPYG